MAYTEKPIKKLYFSISEVSKLLHESESAIRFWCTQFSLDVRKSRHGWRQFREEDIIELREIKYLLRVEQYTIRGAKQKFAIQ